MGTRLRNAAFIVTVLLLPGTAFSQVQASPALLVGGAWSGTVVSPATEAGLGLRLRSGVHVWMMIGYARVHVRDTATMSTITGASIPFRVRIGADVLRAEAAIELGHAAGLMPSFLVGGFAGVQANCEGEAVCTGRRVQVGPAVGARLQPGWLGGRLGLRASVFRSFTRGAAVPVSESGFAIAYHPVVVQLAMEWRLE